MTEANYIVRFSLLIERHVSFRTARGPQGMGRCPFHQEKTPSFSFNLEKGVFHCFSCGASGGVKKFAELVGEPWGTASLTRWERARVAVSIRRREAEAKARAILGRREEKRLDEVFEEWSAANTEVAQAVELLDLFHRRPDLEEEFSDLAAQAACHYGAVVSRRVYLEAQMDGEIEA